LPKINLRSKRGFKKVEIDSPVIISKKLEEYYKLEDSEKSNSNSEEESVVWKNDDNGLL